MDFAENARSVSTPFFLFLFSLVVMELEHPFLAERAETRQDFFKFAKFFLRLQSLRNISAPNSLVKPRRAFRSFDFVIRLTR